jgi:hypothetical protein
MRRSEELKFAAEILHANTRTLGLVLFLAQ